MEGRAVWVVEVRLLAVEVDFMEIFVKEDPRQLTRPKRSEKKSSSTLDGYVVCIVQCEST